MGRVVWLLFHCRIHSLLWFSAYYAVLHRYKNTNTSLHTGIRKTQLYQSNFIKSDQSPDSSASSSKLMCREDIKSWQAGKMPCSCTILRLQILETYRLDPRWHFLSWTHSISPWTQVNFQQPQHPLAKSSLAKWRPVTLISFESVLCQLCLMPCSSWVVRDLQTEPRSQDFLLKPPARFVISALYRGQRIRDLRAFP